MERLALPGAWHEPTGSEPAPTGSGRITAGPLQAFLLVPRTLDPARSYPLVVVLHGAGRQDDLLRRGLDGEADRRQALFLIPRSHAPTWDLIAGGEDVDLRFLAHCLDLVYSRYRVDPDRQAILGYSDGASYGLAIALSNPRRFAAVMAWAPGFVAVDPTDLRDDDPKPRVFLEYGTLDPLFPFDRVALPNREALERLGYPLTFRADEGGGHWPSRRFQPDALDWFLGPVA